MKLKKLFMLTLPVAAISVVTPIVLTSCGSSSDNTTNTSKVSWVDQTATNITFGSSDKQVTGSLTITNGKASLDLNKSVDSTTLEAAIKDDTFKTEISKKVSNPNKVDYKSASIQFSEDKSNGTITVVFGDTNLTISVSNLKVNTPVTQVSWKDQAATDITFGPTDNQVTGSLTITNGNASLDLKNTVDKDVLTSAIKDNSFGVKIVNYINKDDSVNYSSSSLNIDEGKSTGNITITLSDNQTLTINVTNIKVSQSISTPSWKDSSESGDSVTFDNVTGKFTSKNNEATLDLSNNTTAYGLSSTLNSTNAKSFNTIMLEKVQNLGSTTISKSDFKVNSDKKSGVISVELSDNKTILKISVTNIKQVNQSFNTISQTDITFGPDNNKVNAQIVLTSGTSPQLHLKSLSTTTLDVFNAALKDETNSLYNVINQKKWINNNDGTSGEIPSVTVSQNSDDKSKATITYTYVSGNVLTINVDGLKAS